VIGDLRHRIDIRARILAQDEAGGAAAFWTNIASVWAGIVELSSLRTGAGARDNLLRRLAVTIRHRMDVKLGQRLRLTDGAEFDIVSIETTAGRERFLILIAEEARP
jgi:head-tail adaptor